MTDIVDRLRRTDIYDYDVTDKLCDEAADEIERLRACVVAARREGIEAAAEIAKQFAIHQGDAYDIVAAIRTKLLTEDGR